MEDYILSLPNSMVYSHLLSNVATLCEFGDIKRETLKFEQENFINFD